MFCGPPMSFTEVETTKKLVMRPLERKLLTFFLLDLVLPLMLRSLETKSRPMGAVRVFGPKHNIMSEDWHSPFHSTVISHALLPHWQDTFQFSSSNTPSGLTHHMFLCRFHFSKTHQTTAKHHRSSKIEEFPFNRCCPLSFRCLLIPITSSLTRAVQQPSVLRLSGPFVLFGDVSERS